MTASNASILRLRRMTSEPDNETYSDALMASYLEAWPLIDSEGRSSDEDQWTEAYDLHAAAADIWEEKAASYHDKYSFGADGSTYQANQMHENAMEQARYHRARQKASTKLVVKRPVETNKVGTLEFYNPIDDSNTDDDIFGGLF